MKKSKTIFTLMIIFFVAIVICTKNRIVKLENMKVDVTIYALGESQLEKFEGCLFVGDSQTVGMQDVMQSSLPSNCQFSAEIGDSPSDALNRIKSSNVNANQVKLVCLLIGINNPWQISATEELIDYLLETFPSVPIYVQREFYLGASYNDTYTKAAEANAQLDIYNPAVQKYCEQLNSSGKTNVHYIDTTEGFNVTVNGREYLNEDSYAQADGGHFSKAGIEKWLENLANLISNESGTSNTNTTNGTQQSTIDASKFEDLLKDPETGEPRVYENVNGETTVPLNSLFGTKQNYKSFISLLKAAGGNNQYYEELMDYTYGYLLTNEDVSDNIKEELDIYDMSKFFSLIPDSNQNIQD